MNRVLEMLRADPEITAVSFWETTFWGDLETVVNGWYQRRGASEYHRLFKWRPGYVYSEHRPPTVHTPDGTDLRALRWLRGRELSRQGIGLYHYSLLFPRQVLEKESYYQAAGFRNEAMKWSVDCYLGLQQPFRVHNVSAYPSWFEQFSGSHPPAISQLWHDLEIGVIAEEKRSNEDVVRLMSSRGYPLARGLLRLADYPDRLRIAILSIAGRLGRRTKQGAWSILRRLLLGR